MRINPIVKKDVRVQSRSMKICWGVFAYEAIMALTFFIAMLFIQQGYYTGNIYSRIIWLYPVFGVTQLVILGVTVPIRTASAISGEKERQTFDIMMTTAMSPFSIVLGKVLTAIVQTLFYVAASMPVMALAFVIGGLSWSYLLWFFAVALLVSLFSASIGILCSSLCRRTITAILISYGFYVVFFVGTFLPIGIWEMLYYTDGSGVAAAVWTSDLTGLLLLLNPAVYLVEFFTQVMTGESVVAGLSDLTGTAPAHSLMKWLTAANRWIPVSTLLLVAVSFLFLWIASRRINPVKKRTGRIRSKKVGQVSDAQSPEGQEGHTDGR